MPWLVVEGAGSWSPSLGREWVDDESRFPPATAPIDPETGNRRYGYYRDLAKTYKSGAHQVDEVVAAQAVASGLPWLIVKPDTDKAPEVVQVELTGTLTPEDIREGKGAGVRLKESEDAEESAPVAVPVEYEEPVFTHKCAWCSTDPPASFPTPASLDRHIEFEHPAQYQVGHERAVEAARLVAEEAEALRRVSDHAAPVPVWEREAVEQAGLPSAVEPETVVPPQPGG